MLRRARHAALLCKKRCYRLNCVPPKDVEVLALKTCEHDLIWNRVFADDPVWVRSLEWARIQYDCVLMKRGNLDPQTDNVHGVNAV